MVVRQRKEQGTEGWRLASCDAPVIRAELIVPGDRNPEPEATDSCGSTVNSICAEARAHDYTYCHGAERMASVVLPA